MATCTLDIEFQVSFKWWLKPCAYALAVLGLATDERIEWLLLRGTKIKQEWA